MIIINDEQGFVILFVLIALLLTGLISASLLHNSMIGNKIINNYIIDTKAEMTARVGLLVLEKARGKEINIDDGLILSYGEEYNVVINKLNNNDAQELKEFEVIGSYKTNDKVFYYTEPEN